MGERAAGRSTKASRPPAAGRGGGAIRTIGAMRPAATLPLAAASVRLRGKPGRPRKGTAGAQPPDETRVNSGRDGSSQDSQSGRPSLDERRLLDVTMAAAYLGDLGEDTVRELDASGVLTPARVKIPGRGGQPLRKVLFDRLELDRLVAGWRTPA